MTFNSITFLVFFAIVCAFLLLTKLDLKINKEKLRQIRHIILLLASYVFYGWWNVKCAFLMLGLSAVSYFCALMAGKKKGKVFLCIGVIVPLLILGIFKYFNFFIESFEYAFGIKNGIFDRKADAYRYFRG